MEIMLTTWQKCKCNLYHLHKFPPSSMIYCNFYFLKLACFLRWLFWLSKILSLNIPLSISNKKYNMLLMVLISSSYSVLVIQRVFNLVGQFAMLIEDAFKWMRSMFPLRVRVNGWCIQRCTNLVQRCTKIFS